MEDRHIQPVGPQRQPGHHRVHPVGEKGLRRLVPGQVQDPHVGFRVPLAQLTYHRGDDEAARETDGDPAGLGDGAGVGRGLFGETQQGLRPGQEGRSGLGEPAALRVTVQQSYAQALFEATDLPAQRRLRDMESGGRPPVVEVFGDDGEVPHQTQVQVSRRGGRVGHAPMVARQAVPGAASEHPVGLG